MPVRPRVVIVGAGFGGLAAARRLEREAVDVTVVDQRNFHTFQPLLYQVATAGLNAADVAYAVRGIFQRRHRVAFRNARVTGVDLDRAVVHLDDGAVGGADLPYDHLVLAAGSAANFFGTPGAEQHSFPLYSLREAVALRNHVLRRFELADAQPERIAAGELTFVVVGGGPTGVEVAGALAELIQHVLRRDFHTLDTSRARVVLVEQASEVLGAFSPRSRRYARRTLESRGVEVRLGAAVAKVAADAVHFANGDVLHTATLVWAAGVRAADLAAAFAEAAGTEQGRGGRLVVAEDLSLAGHPDVYAVGDVADIADGEGGRLPQLAQVAMQSGRHAAEQILATIERRPRTAFRYHDKGTMATIGRRAAVAELPGGPHLVGPVAWLAWLALHLVALLGMRNRTSVFVNWAWNYLTWDRGPRLIFDGDAPAPDADHPTEHAADAPPAG